MPGSQLDRETSTLILSSATACMQALLPPYNRPAMSNGTTQNSLPWHTQWLTLRTSRQRAAGPWTRCWSHWNIYRGVFCCFCAEWLKGETSEEGSLPADSLSGLLVKKTAAEKKPKKRKIIKNKLNTIFMYEESEYLPVCGFLKWTNVFEVWRYW